MSLQLFSMPHVSWQMQMQTDMFQLRRQRTLSLDIDNLHNSLLASDDVCFFHDRSFCNQLSFKLFFPFLTIQRKVWHHSSFNYHWCLIHLKGLHGWMLCDNSVIVFVTEQEWLFLKGAITWFTMGVETFCHPFPLPAYTSWMAIYHSHPRK